MSNNLQNLYAARKLVENIPEALESINRQITLEEDRTVAIRLGIPVGLVPKTEHVAAFREYILEYRSRDHPGQFRRAGLSAVVDLLNFYIEVTKSPIEIVSRHTIF